MDKRILVIDDEPDVVSFLTRLLQDNGYGVMSASNAVDAMALIQERQQMILEGLGGLPEESEHCAFLAETTLKAAIADYLRAEEQLEHVAG